VGQDTAGRQTKQNNNTTIKQTKHDKTELSMSYNFIFIVVESGFVIVLRVFPFSATLLISSYFKTRKMSNTKPTKNWGVTQMLVKGTQFLLHIRHPLCSSYMQSCLVKVLVVIEERKKST
jgi:hypothetical protein